jgi:DNA polymerase I-like protein with 3'-5' exonuclease and polymerase domains
VLLHFDWICADLRAASILSQDPNLIQSFKDSDPYSYLSQHLTGDKQQLREEAKILLLKTINKLDHSNEYVEAAYPKMCGWLSNLLSDIHMTNKSYNVVGRPFILSKERGEKSLLNATLQGSVASAMQSVMWKVRQILPSNIVCDIHDGLVLAIEKDQRKIHKTIETVSEIFSRPFFGYIQDDPFFPYRVSMGQFWKDWKVIKEVHLS